MKHKMIWLINNVFLLKLFWKNARKKSIIEIGIKCYQSVVSVFSFVWLLNRLLIMIQSGKSLKEMLVIIGIFFVLYLLGAIILSWYNCRFAPVENVKIRSKLDKLLIDEAKQLQIKYYENQNFFDTLQQAKDCVRTTAFEAFSNLTQGISSLLAFFSAILIIISIDPWLIVFCVFIFPMIFFSKYYGKIVAEKEKTLTKHNRIKNCVEEIMVNKDRAMEMRTSSAGKIPDHYFNKAQENILSIHKKFGKKMFSTNFIMTECSITFISIFCYLYGIIRSTAMPSYMVAEFSVMMVAVMNMVTKLRILFKCYENACNYSVKVNVLKEYLGFKYEESGKRKVESFESLEFQNVSFEYGGEMILSNVSFKVNRGEKIAVVGMNGAGKTTVVKLILRLYDVTQGKILYNDVDIREYDLKSYREQFAALFQDFYLFDNISISKNVLMNPCLNNDAVNRALINAGLKKNEIDIHRFVSREYDDSGVVMSGGQKQKVAIARLYCKKFEFAILDEPSASLDPISAKNLFNNLIENMKEKTVMTVGHQLSVLSSLDRILLFEKGRIIESGTHNDLMKQKKLYYNMYIYQTKQYDEK